MRKREEEVWNICEAKVYFDALSESGEESEEHDSGDVNIYLGFEDDDEDDNVKTTTRTTKIQMEGRQTGLHPVWITV